MSVIADLRLPADSFELGRILEMEENVTITLETMVPLGQNAVPFFSVHNQARDGFEVVVRDHPSVERLQMVSEHENETLYALNWMISRDVVFEGFHELGVQLLEARGTADTWEFELRFASHEDLATFQEYCSDAHISIEVDRIYNPTKPDGGPWYGLTALQRETLLFAARNGYYSIPRGISTQDLADEFDVSDQAITERLRRGVSNLIENTLPVVEEINAEQRATDEGGD